MVEKKKNDEVYSDAFKLWITNKANDTLNSILVGYGKLHITFKDKDYSPRSNGIAMMTMQIMEEYNQFHLDIYPVTFRFWMNGKKKDIVDCLIHEMAHIHTNEINELAESRFPSKESVAKAQERVTEVMAEYIRRYLRGINSKVYSDIDSKQKPK